MSCTELSYSIAVRDLWRRSIRIQRGGRILCHTV